MHMAGKSKTVEERRTEEIVLSLSRLSDETLMAIIVGALAAKRRDPIESILNIAQLLSTLTEVLNDSGRVTITDAFRSLADNAERPILLARIARSWN